MPTDKFYKRPGTYMRPDTLQQVSANVPNDMSFYGTSQTPGLNHSLPTTAGRLEGTKLADTEGISTTLRQGHTGDQVKQLQALLNSKGYNLAMDGKFGAKTRKALVEFQSDYNKYMVGPKDPKITVDGILGRQTLGALMDRYTYNKGSGKVETKRSPVAPSITPPDDVTFDQTSQIGELLGLLTMTPGVGSAAGSLLRGAITPTIGKALGAELMAAELGTPVGVAARTGKTLFTQGAKAATGEMATVEMAQQIAAQRVAAQAAAMAAARQAALKGASQAGKKGMQNLFEKGMTGARNFSRGNTSGTSLFGYNEGGMYVPYC